MKNADAKPKENSVSDDRKLEIRQKIPPLVIISNLKRLS